MRILFEIKWWRFKRSPFRDSLVVRDVLSAESVPEQRSKLGVAYLSVTLVNGERWTFLTPSNDGSEEEPETTINNAIKELFRTGVLDLTDWYSAQDH